MSKSLSIAALIAGCVLVSGSVSAQGFLDVNAIRVQSAETDEQTYFRATTLYSEVALFGARYPKLPAGPGLDVSGGWISPVGLGFHVQVDYAKYESTVGLQIRIPSPYFFVTSADDQTVTNGKLDRTQFGVNFGALYQIPLPTDRVALKVFGGPTYFHIDNEMISDIFYNQQASRLIRSNVVSITSYDTDKVKGSTIGYHVGADVGFFFSRHVGVGGVIRYTHGTVSLRDPVSQDDVDLEVGGTTLGGGLRLRF